MRSEDEIALNEGAAEAIRLCESYRLLHDTRTDLDRRLMALPEGDEQRDSLWEHLEVVLQQLSDLARRLAASPSNQPAALRAKAAVLALLLRSAGNDPAAVLPEAAALALSVADGVASLPG